MKYIGLFPINGIETLKNDKTNQICEGFTGVLCGDDFLLSWLITRTCFVPRSDVVVCRLATSETVSSLSVMATGYNSAYYVHKHPPHAHVCGRAHASMHTLSLAKGQKKVVSEGLACSMGAEKLCRY